MNLNFAKFWESVHQTVEEIQTRAIIIKTLDERRVVIPMAEPNRMRERAA